MIVRLILSLLVLVVVSSAIFTFAGAACKASPTVSAGFVHMAALSADCTVWLWGKNKKYALGRADVSEEAPSPVKALKGITQISTQHNYTLALSQNGQVFAMGEFFGKRDHQTPTKLEAASAPIKGITNVTSVAAGWDHALFLKRDGTVWAVGGNNSGQLGVPDIPGTDSPVMVPRLPKIKFVAAGSHHSLAISESGDVWAWGWNKAGQLGIGLTNDSEGPTRVPDIKNIKMLAGGLWHSIALDAEGQVWVWGDNQHWQLGLDQGKESLFPKRHLTMEPIVSVGADYDRSIALSNTGSVYAWGGEWGKPGVQFIPCNLKAPYRVWPLEKVIHVALGAHAAIVDGIYGVRPNGDVVNWRPRGKNYICEGTHPDEEEPVSHVIREGGSVLNLFWK